MPTVTGAWVARAAIRDCACRRLGSIATPIFGWPLSGREGTLLVQKFGEDHLDVHLLLDKTHNYISG